jgi:energy-coupling factor transporter ATP-binding protein EcfA2
MLTRLYATNYRCLVNFDFKPNAKQLIIGRNGTGKSTVFDVLAMLRDFAVRGEPCEDHFGGRTRTRWQRVIEQRFEAGVRGNGGEYRYTVTVDERGSPPRPRVRQEALDFNGERLFQFEEGVVGTAHDLPTPHPTYEFPFDWHRSALAVVEVDRWDDDRLAWFKRWLGRLVQVQINPWAMSARSESEARYPTRNLGNFADWYRHLRLESGDAVFEAIKDLREAIPGFEALDAKEAGLDVRVLQATFTSPSGSKVELPFHDLSEGQRALIALYVLLHCAVGNDRLLVIDEPDNFIALAEIQPWLLKLLDRVDETNGQVMLVSHHPELLDQLASQGGVLFERPGGGETRVQTFEPPEDSGLKASEIVARGWELREPERLTVRITDGYFGRQPNDPTTELLFLNVRVDGPPATVKTWRLDLLREGRSWKTGYFNPIRGKIRASDVSAETPRSADLSPVLGVDAPVPAYGWLQFRVEFPVRRFADLLFGSTFVLIAVEDTNDESTCTKVADEWLRRAEIALY